MYAILKNEPHSDKILLCSDGEDEFAYKVVYKNGDGYKPQRGMGIVWKFKTLLCDGKYVHSQFLNGNISEVIGRKRLAGTY